MVYTGIFGQGSGLCLQVTPGCAGDENSLFSCPPQNYFEDFYQEYYTCDYHLSDIGVRCMQGMVENKYVLIPMAILASGCMYL